MRLFKPHGRNGYCGPAALSAIFNISTDQVAQIIRLRTGRAQIKSTSGWELCGCVQQINLRLDLEIGWRFSEAYEGHTLRYFYEHDIPTGHWLLNCTTHWIVYHDSYLVDSGAWIKSKEPTFALDLQDKRLARRRIKRAVHIDCDSLTEQEFESIGNLYG